jgi:Tfp pilus assembly protein PilF
MSRLNQSVVMALFEIALIGIACPLPAAAQSPEDFYRLGTQFFAERKPAEAIAALERSVQLKPDYAAAWKALGVVYASGSDYQQAERPFRNACEREAGLQDACLYYGRTLYLLNQFEPALQVLRAALRTDRNNSQIYRLMALSEQALGQTSEAGAAFQAAVRLHRGGVPDEDPGIDYGVYLFRLGWAEQALDPLESVLKRYPDGARAHLELGCVLLALDRLSEAQVHLERAVALDPRSSRAHLLLGKLYLRLGKTEAGEQQLQVAATLLRSSTEAAK